MGKRLGDGALIVLMAAVAAMAVLAMVLAQHQSNSLADSHAQQVAACERGNTIRAVIRNNAEVSRRLWLLAAFARAHTASAPNTTLNDETARAYTALARQFRKPPDVDCDRLVK